MADRIDETDALLLEALSREADIARRRLVEAVGRVKQHAQQIRSKYHLGPGDRLAEDNRTIRRS